MAFLKQDNKRAVENDNGFGIIPEGDYEVIVSGGAFRDDAQQSWPNFNLELTIRSDVDQEFKGRKVFHTFWLSQKKETSLQVCMNMIEAFGHKVGVPDGVEFETEQQWVNFVIGKPVKAHVVIEEYNNKEKNVVKYFNESEFMEVRHVEEKKTEYNSYTRVDDDPFANNGKTLDISDDDLPF